MALLEKFATVDVALGLTPDELNEKVKVSDALIIRSATQVTKAVFDASAGRLKVVGRAGVGVDNVDLGAATAAGCLVVNAPTANTVAAAEHGIALLTAVARNVAQADASIKAGRWDRSKYVGVSMVGKTLAVIGFGKVGSEVGRRGRGLGFNVVAYDPYASEAKAAALGVKLVSLDDALATADFFSLHMPMTPETKGLFNDALFAKMKRGARVVNVARGGVIDDAALVRALDAGIVAAAALDVFEKEPPPPDHPLTHRPDVVCTPHLGASTVEAQEDVGVEIAEAVIDALQGKLAATAVNAPMVAPEVLAELAPYTRLAQVGRQGRGGGGEGRVARDARSRALPALARWPLTTPSTMDQPSDPGGPGHRGETGRGRGFPEREKENETRDGRTRPTPRTPPLFSQALGRTVVQLVGDVSSHGGFGEVAITYATPRGDDLDSRLLRAMVVKGILEQITTANVNLVNADLLAKQRGLRVVEKTVPATGDAVLDSMTVTLATSSTRFSAALDRDGVISAAGAVRDGVPYLTRVGAYDTELGVDGIVLLTRQTDRPGIIAAVSALLGDAGINISYMTVSRTGKGADAIMAIGVDAAPPKDVLDRIPGVEGVTEFAVVKEDAA
jgi:D-3-phosphoglycerate dehydrogenase